MFEVYKPSGGFGISTFFYLPIGLVAAALLAIAYAYGLRYIPLIIINVLMAGVFALAVGRVILMVVKRGHCRNMWLAGFLALLLALFAVTAKHYIQYQLWVSNVTDAKVESVLRDGTIKHAEAEDVRKMVRGFVTDEVSFLKRFKVRADEGMVIRRRGNNGAPLTGVFIYLIWVFELGGVLLMSWVASVDTAKEPYSEKLGMWASKTEEAMYLPISSGEMVEQIKSATTVEELLRIPIPKSLGGQRHAFYDIRSVPGEEMEDAYLTVKLHEKIIDKNGKEKMKETKLVENAILTSDQRIQLLENASLLEEALEDYRQAMDEEEV